MNEQPREFQAVDAVRGEEPLLLGMVGPPGGGKTLSSLRVAKGIQEVRGGDIIVIDTEGGRARKFADQIKFKCVEFNPPCRSQRFFEAIKQQLPLKPAAIIVDSLSDEHEGEGGYLEWHDEMVPKMGGNEWAAWAAPKASRKRLITGILHIKTPLIFTFRAREKTRQGRDQRGKTTIENMGWQPVAPLEIVHTLDMTCILPPRADGIPIWKSDKIGEDFIMKLPMQFRHLFAKEGRQLDESIGTALAEWAKGGQPSPRSTPRGAAADQPPAAQPTEASQAGGAVPPEPDERLMQLDEALAEAAEQGIQRLQEEWTALHPTDQKRLKAALDKRHKVRAVQVDNQQEAQS